ncbi:hypothetical protein [Parahaliea mediterranea]|uniref:Uncharacterized protein n=1 Tax=Parahaliea mediterranea TaxID=651086 RepID=A0A939DFP7_9GAMM|nr:hypothetical protein [Parahaliea mediterranea]MBN7796687.1 hypothetical protein [Parahaliea mediterranea]
MAQHQTQTIPREKFLLMSVNLLHRALLETNRTQAKNLYRELSEGRAVHLTNVQMEDRSTVRFDLSLDHSEYRGKLNFGTFRTSLTVLIARLSDALREQRNITVFTAENDPNVMIFGVTGVTWQDGEPSVLVLGADSGAGQPSVMLKLMYLDHSQFGEPGEGLADGSAENSVDSPEVAGADSPAAGGENS